MSLRFDGLYVEREGAGRLRFYPDGDVVVIASTGTAQEVSRWISRERDTFAHWTHTNGELAFSLLLDFADRGEPASVQAIHHTGAVEGETLRLRVVSEITGYDAVRMYDFVAVVFGRA